MRRGVQIARSEGEVVLHVYYAGKESRMAAAPSRNSGPVSLLSCDVSAELVVSCRQKKFWILENNIFAYSFEL